MKQTAEDVLRSQVWHCVGSMAERDDSFMQFMRRVSSLMDEIDGGTPVETATKCELRAMLSRLRRRRHVAIDPMSEQDFLRRMRKMARKL